MKARIDWGLYLVTDRRLAGSRPLEEVVRAAVRGGVTAVQLREKECGTAEFVELARKLKVLLAPMAIPLMVNDRVDVALASGADGVHIGQLDMAYGDVRRLVGPDAIIGLSVQNEEQAADAASLDVAYLGASPIFPTPTKSDTGPPCGIEGLSAMRRASRHVLVAIGGIDVGNAATVMGAGADGVAVVSAICAASDPETAARELRRIVDQARKGRGGK